MTDEAKPASRSELADLLEGLDAKATEGPWAWDQRGEKVNEWGLGVAFDRDEKPLSGRFTDEDAQYVEQVCQTEGATVNYSDPELICALRNNLPTIIAALRSVVSELGRNDAQDAARYRLWRKHYHTDFALHIDSNGKGSLVFLPGRPMVEVAGKDYEAKVDAALDVALLSERPEGGK